MARQIVVVTGVSTEIGRSIAEVLLEKGLEVFGTVRKESDAVPLRSKYGPAFTSLVMDITDQAAIVACADQVKHSLQGATLAGLVNNAGMSLVGPVLHQLIEDLRRQMEVNLIGPAIATQASRRS